MPLSQQHMKNILGYQNSLCLCLKKLTQASFELNVNNGQIAKFEEGLKLLKIRQHLRRLSERRLPGQDLGAI